MDALHKGGAYECLASVRLVGMMLIIAISKNIRRSDIKFNIQSVGTGALNIMGNKGGVGVSMVINKTYVCFVNSHLAAHTTEVEQRKEDHDEILRRMIFQHGIQRLSINEHHMVFWFGDLNYRLDESSELIKTLIKKNKYDELIVYDQLYKQRNIQAVFQGYNEGNLLFPPTYKYNPGTDDFDSSEKARAPAWCDRVLWRGSKTDITLQEYNSIMQMRLSDHKPIYAIFTAQIPSIDHDKMKKINEEILKTMDKYENDNQPQITVSETDIDFEIIKFNEKYTRELIVANNHHLPVEFNFRVKDKRGSGDINGGGGQQERICENWLNIYPQKGKLVTGQTLSIFLEVIVDPKSAAELNFLQKKSNTKIPLDILVLHVENGRDTFISIIGEYKPSCYGFSFEILSRLPEPLSTINLEDISTLVNCFRDENFVK